MIESFKIPTASFSSVSGAVCSFDSQYAGLPLKSHKIALTATQSGSGTPSPSNPRSISGWSKIRIGQLGNSPLNSYFEGLYNGTYGFADLGSLTWYLNDAGQFYTAQTNPTGKQDLTGSNLICSDKYTGGNAYTGDTDKTICIVGESLGRIWVKDSDYSDVTSFKNSLSGVYLIYELKTPTTPTITDTQFDTLLTAFGVSGSMFTIQIGSTVYGGEYDAVSGVLTVTHKLVVFDGSEQGWTLNQVQSNNAVYITLSDKKVGWQTSICDKMQNVNGCWGNSTDNGLFCDHPSLKRLYFNRPDNSLSLFFTVDDWKTWLSSNNVRVCYELETPITIQLPPCPIDTLEGVNNIWADTGDTTLQYMRVGR